MKTIWVVTKEVNDYNQHGDYFVGIFINKPEFKHLKQLLPNEPNDTIGKLIRGGGRKNFEDVWYTLFEAKSGSNYEE